MPSGEIKVKCKEFLELKQGSMSVREYLTKFTQLSRYASSDVDTDDKKQDCFRDGLNPGIRYALSSNEYDTFQKLVDKAFTVERERKVLEADRKRKMAFQGQSSGSNTRPLKALVWFWLIDETLSVNLVYQSDYEIDSTTPSDEAMVKIMMMVMAW